MTKKAYLEKRKALLDEAQNLLNEGKLEEYRAKENEIKDLDAQFEEIATAQANMNALAENPVVTDIANLGVQVAGATPAAAPIPAAPQPMDEANLYRVAFAKTMMGMALEQNEVELFNRVNAEFRRANATQTAAQHSILIPETVRNGIWQEIGEAHPIIGDLAMTFVPGDLTIIKEENPLSDAKALDEDDEAGDDDELGFGELNLSGCELAKAITISWKMKKMSIDAFLTYITSKIAEKMGNALAKWVTVGKGKPGTGDIWKAQARGIETVLVAESGTPQIVTYTGNVEYDTMVDALGKIKSGYLNGSAIYAKNTVIWGQLAKIKDDNKRPMFIPDVTTGGVGRMFGLVVKEEDGIPDDEILIGNVSKGYVINANENISMYQEDHVKQRITDYMGYAIIDGDVLTTKAFAIIKKSA